MLLVLLNAVGDFGHYIKLLVMPGTNSAKVTHTVKANLETESELIAAPSRHSRVCF